SESPAFQFRTERKQADVAAIAAHFRVDTTGKPLAAFQDEEPAVAKELLQFFCVDTIALNRDLFRTKSDIYDGDERIRVSCSADAFAKFRYRPWAGQVLGSGEDCFAREAGCAGQFLFDP